MSQAGVCDSGTSVPEVTPTSRPSPEAVLPRVPQLECNDVPEVRVPVAGAVEVLAPLAPYLLRIEESLLPHPAFAGSVLQVPVYDPTVAPEVQQADAYMGVYAPTGVVCAVSAFLADASPCGLP